MHVLIKQEECERERGREGAKSIEQMRRVIRRDGAVRWSHGGEKLANKSQKYDSGKRGTDGDQRREMKDRKQKGRDDRVRRARIHTGLD